MAFGTHHVHVKTRDPKKTMQFYVDNLGATLLADQGARGYRVSLHGLQLNITPLIDTQKREQHYGIEHIAVDTGRLHGDAGSASGERGENSRGAAAQQRPAGLFPGGPRRSSDRSHREGVVPRGRRPD